MAYKICGGMQRFVSKLSFENGTNFIAGIDAHKNEVFPLEIKLHFWVIYYKRYLKSSLEYPVGERYRKTHRKFYISTTKISDEELKEILENEEDYQFTKKIYEPTIESIEYLGQAYYHP